MQISKRLKQKVLCTLYPATARCKALACVGIFLLALFAPDAYAAQRLQSPQARTLSIQAAQSAGQGRWEIARNVAMSAQDPLAAKLYYWMLFTRKDNPQDYRVLTRFIRENPDWPGIPGMKALAEKYVPDNVSAAEVIAWFDDYQPVTARGVDRYMQALIDSARTDRAKAFIAQWWVSTSLSREDQRMIYRKYGRYIDRNAHLGRFDIMLLRAEYSNARALAEVLGPGYTELAEARIALATQGGNAEALIARVPQALQRDAGLLYERLRWRRINNLDVGAMEILNNPPAMKDIHNPKDWWKERHIIVRRLLERRMYESAYLIASKHNQDEGFEFSQAEWLAGWLALRFMNNPTKAFEHFEAMYRKVSTPVSKARGAYWLGRAALSFGNQDMARQWLQEAAQYQTVFYGQLAGLSLGQDYGLPHAAPPVLDGKDLQDFKSDELIQMARILNAAGEKRDAGRFLYAFVDRHKSSKGYRYAAELAIEMNRLSDAVRISKDATSEGMFLTAQSYPVIQNHMGSITLDKSVAHAIIRQESMFDYDARSPAGALGLMQLMPATATETARKIGVPHQQSMLTSNPAHNIQLGSAYFQQLLNRFDGCYPMAIAGYNAGPGRIPGWIEDFGDPRTGQIDMIDWIEMIPIYETRNYVQRVMENGFVYNFRLNGASANKTSNIYQKPPCALIR